MNNRFIDTKNTCPNCSNVSFMFSTEWGHSLPCCSNECGLEIKEKLLINENKKEYKKTLKKIERLKDRALKLRFTGINY